MERVAADRRESVERAELRYRSLVERLPLGLYIRPLDMSRPNIYVSPQVEPMLGYPVEDWLTDPGILGRIVHPDDRERVVADAARVRATGEPLHTEYRYVRPDGRIVWVHDETYRLPGEDGGEVVLGFLLDITDRKRAEEERDRLREGLHRAQKLEAIGRLAGGIAHDFNNMLTAIKGYGQLLLEELEPGTAAHDEASQILRAAEQASALPAALLAFSRNQPHEPQIADVDELVAGAAGFLRHLISESIDVVLVPAPEPAFARLDPRRLEPMLVNLALNARDAMPHGGTVTVSVAVTTIDAGRAVEQGVEPGRYVAVTVADDGHGMDEETAARAHEPFFTTKVHGTGLGLPSVGETVSQCGGFVSITSRPGEGTSVSLHFPAVPAPVPAGAVGTEPGRSLVLVAEDEDVVRELIGRVLARGGYDVRAAEDGFEALRLLQGLERPVDLLLTDTVMPRIGGPELAEAVLGQQPEAAVVFVSGYTEHASALAGPGGMPPEFLRKPFSPAELLHAVEHALERRGARPGAAAAEDLATAAPFPALTPRERQILSLISDGQTNERIAGALGISPDTVQSHVRNAMAKLEAASRTEAVATALRRALIA